MTQPTDSGLKLLPCPFCGGKAEYNREDDHTTACCLNTNCPAFQIEATTTAWNTRPSAPADEAVKLAIGAIERTLHGHKKENCLLCEMRYGYAKLEGECHKCGLLDALTTLKNLEAKLNGGK